MNEISANNDNYQLSGEQDTQDISKKLHERYTKNDIVLAIGRNKGIKTAIARELDCTIYQLNHYLNIHSELKPLLKDAKKEIIGLAEEVMLQNL